MSGDEGHRKPTFKKMFITGVIFIFPIGVTIWLFGWLISRTQSISRPHVEKVFAYLLEQQPPDWLLTVVSTILVLSFVLLVGMLANFYVGKKLLNLVDKIMLNLPVIRSVYGGTKQIIDAFSFQRGSGSFKKVVLLEYPKKDSWVLGFITNENWERSQELFGQKLISVFVPSTPNPTTGFLLYLGPKELHLVDLTVEEAVKLIVSAGLVMPAIKKKPIVSLAQHWEDAGTPSVPMAEAVGTTTVALKDD